MEYTHIQLLFEKARDRDAAYGREMSLLRGTSDVRDPILYHAKGIHLTGIKRWGIAEKLPTIELVIQASNQQVCQIAREDYRVSKCNHISEATLNFATKNHPNAQLTHFSESLSVLVDRHSLGSRFNIRNSRDLSGNTYNYLDGFVTGIVGDVLVVHDAAKSSGIKYASFSISFGEKHGV